MNRVDIKEIRKQKGLKQQDLSKKLGIAASTLAHYESGIRKMPLDMFLKLLDVCNLEFNLKEKSTKKR